MRSAQALFRRKSDVGAPFSCRSTLEDRYPLVHVRCRQPVPVTTLLSPWAPLAASRNAHDVHVLVNVLVSPHSSLALRVVCLSSPGGTIRTHWPLQLLVEFLLLPLLSCWLVLIVEVYPFCQRTRGILVPKCNRGDGFPLFHLFLGHAVRTHLASRSPMVELVTSE